MATIHGIEIEEGALAAAIFCNATLETTGACTTLDARKAARVMLAAPRMLEALKEARAMLETASRYFPKSIKNGDRFALLNVLANSINPAIAKAEGGKARCR